jgi:hypothetical protein
MFRWVRANLLANGIELECMDDAFDVVQVLIASGRGIGWQHGDWCEGSDVSKDDMIASFGAMFPMAKGQVDG